MTTVFGSLLATVLIAQIQGGMIQGKVVDDQGRPVADSLVLLYVPYTQDFIGNCDPVEVQARTDASGQFGLTLPTKRRVFMDQAFIWAYRPGFAVAVTRQLDPAVSLNVILRKPQPKTITVEGHDGKPVAGAIVSPRFILGAGPPWADMPGALANLLAVTTGRDGQAELGYLAGGDRMGAVRVTAASIGTQDLQLMEYRLRDVQPATIKIRLGPVNNLAGRVRDGSGKPVAGQTVELWSIGGSYLPPHAVGFRNGPLHTAADGSFRTPDNLLVGSKYRVVVRAPGFEPILSKWITVTDQPRVLLPIIQRPLRSLSGRVVDRQGNPLANVEVFQSGDGPERTTTKTDRDGRFTLGGFCQGQVFLFARGQEFRFFGRLVKPGENEIQVELTRTSERPAREMRMLPEPIPLEESQALAKSLDGTVLASGRGPEGRDRRHARALRSRGGRRRRKLREAGEGRGYSEPEPGLLCQARSGAISGPNRSGSSR